MYEKNNTLAANIKRAPDDHVFYFRQSSVKVTETHNICSSSVSVVVTSYPVMTRVIFHSYTDL